MALLSDNLPKGAFGELITANLTAFIQNVAAYNLIPSNFREFSSLGGSTGVQDALWETTSGTSAGGYGAIQSFRALPYNAGQGGRVKFAGRFDTPQAGSWVGIGALSVTDELSFGYNGTEFGIWHRYRGSVEVRTITITGAAGGNENLTLTLNDVAYTIPLTTGTTTHNAYEIEAWLGVNQSVWATDQIGSTIIISALSDGAKSGTYSFSSSTATGTIAQNTAGVTKTSDFVAQNDWNQNTLSSWETPLNPQNGNVYRIKYQYLGFGDIVYEVEDPEIGDFVEVHKIKYANNNTLTSLSNPSLRFGMYSANITNTTSITTRCSSVAMFVEGTPVKTRNPRADKNTQTITTSAYTNIISIKNRTTYNYKNNQVEIEPILLTIANESTKNLRIELRGNPTFSGETNFSEIGTNLVSLKDTTANTVTGGRLLGAFTVGGGGSEVIDLTLLQISVPPTLTISISGQLTSGSSSPATATLTWYEDL